MSYRANREKNSDKNYTVRRYRADSNKLNTVSLFALYRPRNATELNRDLTVHSVDFGRFQVPSSNVGQGSQCRPVGLSHYVGPSAIPRKFPAILGTESHGRNSKERNCPRSHDYIAS